MPQIHTLFNLDLQETAVPLATRVSRVSRMLQMSEFRCPLCAHRSGDKQSMDDHTATVHKIAFKLQCSKCSYNTPHPGHLKKHMKEGGSEHFTVNALSCICDYFGRA